MKFLRQHIAAILIGVIVALFAYLGQQQIDELRDKLGKVACETSSQEAEKIYKAIELKIMGVYLDDITTASDVMTDVASAKKRYKDIADQCKRERQFVERIESLEQGLNAYNSENFEKAIKHLEKLPKSTEYELYVLLRMENPTITVGIVHEGDRIDLFEFAKQVKADEDIKFFKDLTEHLSLLGLVLADTKLLEKEIQDAAKKVMGKIRPKEKA